MKNIGKYLYWILLALVVMPWDLMVPGLPQVVAKNLGAIALFIGLVFALSFGIPHPKFNKKLSKLLLQASVVGLGFGMNIEKSLQSGADGMLFTIVSVAMVMVLGVMIGKWFRIDEKTSYLISSGTAICGGSAIAAVGGVLKADGNKMAVALGVVFILNAIALFLFPPLGRLFEMTDQQFGTWAAIAIHDTSSVVGAGAAFSDEACEIATLVKCTRALWIIPLAFVTMLVFRDRTAKSGNGKAKVSVPMFIIYFVIAMVVNTYTRDLAPSVLAPTYDALAMVAKKALVAVLFAIGAGLSLDTIKQVGVKPLLQAILLWVVIGVSSFFVVMNIF